jgi:hypothetical protein
MHLFVLVMSIACRFARLYTAVPSTHCCRVYTPPSRLHTAVPSTHRRRIYTPPSRLHNTVPSTHRRPVYTPPSLCESTRLPHFSCCCPGFVPSLDHLNSLFTLTISMSSVYYFSGSRLGTPSAASLSSFPFCSSSTTSSKM